MLSGAATVLPIISQAAIEDFTGVYLAASYGRERNNFDTHGYDADLAATTAPLPMTIEDRSVRRLANIWWVNGGYFFNPHVGADLAFLHLGRFEYQTQGTLTQTTGDQSLYTAASITSHGPALSLIGRLPLTTFLEVDARIGDYVAKTESRGALVTGTIHANAHTSESKSSLLAGAGVAFAVTDHWSLRADYLHINKTGNSVTGKFNIDLVSAGIRFTF